MPRVPCVWRKTSAKCVKNSGHVGKVHRKLMHVGEIMMNNCLPPTSIPAEEGRKR